MIVPVHMFAFADEGDRSKIREVEIPDEKAKFAKIYELLELVFKYGQNDFQPKPFPSVSVGDVAEINGEYYMVMRIGWKQITKKQFDTLQPPTGLYEMEMGIKDAAKSTDELDTTGGA